LVRNDSGKIPAAGPSPQMPSVFRQMRGTPRLGDHLAVVLRFQCIEPNGPRRILDQHYCPKAGGAQENRQRPLHAVAGGDCSRKPKRGGYVDDEVRKIYGLPNLLDFEFASILTNPL